jgi:predicted alpha/beta hydrolase family esterase
LILAILKVQKGDSKDWDNPLLDWLESLNCNKSAEGEIIIVAHSLACC